MVDSGIGYHFMELIRLISENPLMATIIGVLLLLGFLG